MSKLYFAVFFVISFILKIALLCDSCQNAFESFQEILQNRQQAGRFSRNDALSLSRKRVFTNMECLDFCLRNAACDFFELRQVVGINKKRKRGICILKKRLSSSHIDTKLVKVRKWIHFNVSSQYLHQVSLAALPLRPIGMSKSWFKKLFDQSGWFGPIFMRTSR